MFPDRRRPVRFAPKRTVARSSPSPSHSRTAQAFTPGLADRTCACEASSASSNLRAAALNWHALNSDSPALCDAGSGFDPAKATHEMSNKVNAKRTIRTFSTRRILSCRAFRASTEQAKLDQPKKKPYRHSDVLQLRAVLSASRGPAALFCLSLAAAFRGRDSVSRRRTALPGLRLFRSTSLRAQ